MALSLQQVFDEASTLQLQRTQPLHGSHGTESLLAPSAPAGYQLIGAPMPLSRDGMEGLWIGYAYHLIYNIPGMLVYDESQEIYFYTPDEAIRAVFATLDTMMDLIDECSPSFLKEHMQSSYALWQAWSRIHAPQADTRICLFCWREANPGQVFPPAESSKSCERHKHLLGSVSGHHTRANSVTWHSIIASFKQLFSPSIGSVGAGRKEAS